MKLDICKPGMNCYLELNMNQFHFQPDERCYLWVVITPNVAQLTDRLFVVLDVWGTYFFYPSWTEQRDYATLDFPAQDLPATILDFTWPHDSGAAGGLQFFSAVLDEDMNLTSNVVVSWEFGFSDWTQ